MLRFEILIGDVLW